ncbi:hypothetical protein BP6252_10731 [Coleophoma cylindrospora]|uniref:Uncharacterized protein n=1 Tax=Coleophoma cylindrospora TaxID=1849047 RepID=A0A3D8QTU4_9HELO|nr:hypothetical protein BP6252_10731 [Coleophoma cylindrospora]
MGVRSGSRLGFRAWPGPAFISPTGANSVDGGSVQSGRVWSGLIGNAAGGDGPGGSFWKVRHEWVYPVALCSPGKRGRVVGAHQPSPAQHRQQHEATRSAAGISQQRLGRTSGRAPLLPDKPPAKQRYGTLIRATTRPGAASRHHRAGSEADDCTARLLGPQSAFVLLSVGTQSARRDWRRKGNVVAEPSTAAAAARLSHGRGGVGRERAASGPQQHGPSPVDEIPPTGQSHCSGMEGGSEAPRPEMGSALPDSTT